MENGRQRGERLQIMLTSDELSVLDDFRYQTRMPSRAAAIRELLKVGLEQVKKNASPGMKSADYGVLGRAIDGTQKPVA